MKAQSIVRWQVALAAAVAFGCAQVSVRKVPSPTQYSHWTDTQQQYADGMQGVRFYLPRPFLNVFESFPVRTDIYLVNGMVSPDGKYVIISQVRNDSGLAKYVASPLGTAELPVSSIKVPAANPSSTAESVTEDLVNAKVKDAVAAAAGENAKVPIGVAGSPVAKATPAAKSTGGTGPQAQTGINTQASTNDNSAFAFQPLRGNFDLLYLPDFEEQFVASSFSGLGNAQFQLNLGQGWSLQGMNATADNSALNQRIFDLIDTSVKLAKAAATAELGPAGIPLNLLTGQSATQTVGPTTSPAFTPGSPVSLKIVVVHYAAKGLYPVLKPRELQARKLSKTPIDYGIFNLFVPSPHLQYASDFDDQGLAAASQAVDNETGDFTVPRYPYQYVSFNTFRYMAVQLIRSNDAPFGELYDKTGTKGDAGDRQNPVDLTPGKSPPPQSSPGTKPVVPTPTSADPVAFLKTNGDNLRKALTDTDNTIQVDGVSYEISQAMIDPAKQTLTAKLKTRGDSGKQYNEADVKKGVLDAANKLAVAKFKWGAKDPGPFVDAIVAVTSPATQPFKP
ncbi:MAG TPA: hypothetical protein VG269_29310 [Tepidisphaeraceae bacterium]|nr:hypothetical protein [Tepidisphaeraceae bacterium]